MSLVATERATSIEVATGVDELLRPGDKHARDFDRPSASPLGKPLRRRCVKSAPSRRNRDSGPGPDPGAHRAAKRWHRAAARWRDESYREPDSGSPRVVAPR